MERIQSALAKARAAREGSAPPPPADASERPVHIPSTGTVGGPLPDRPAALPPEAAREAAEPGRPRGAAERARLDAEWAALRAIAVNPTVLERAHVVAATGGTQAAPFDVMRTKLLHQMRANGWRRVAITSPGPSCGKSTIALNLAFSLARQDDLRILLAEADLRRPSLAATLGIKDQRGMAEVLEGTAEPSEALVRHGANLAVLPAAGGRRNPADLFQAPGTGAALDAIEARYEPTLTLFDMPPMLIGDDVMAFMGLVDSVLLIAAAESTTIKEIDACERELATRTNVMGVVLNKCRYLGRDQGYGYGHYG
jgi:protein-tyrosine kinase